MGVQISVSNDIALITMPSQYELVDMVEIIDFIHGHKDYGVPIADVRFVVYDCRAWEWYNVLGGELMELHFDPARPGATLFCGLHGHMGQALEWWVQEICDSEERRSPLFFASVEEGMDYVRLHPKKQ